MPPYPDLQTFYPGNIDGGNLEDILSDTLNQNEVGSRTGGFFNGIKKALGNKNDNENYRIHRL